MRERERDDAGVRRLPRRVERRAGRDPYGTAIVLRCQAFSNLAFRDIPLSGDGNHAELAVGVHRATGRRFRAASIHLDSDVEPNRGREANALMSALPPAAGTTDVVCGDFNEDAVTCKAGGIVQARGVRRRAGRRRQPRTAGTAGL